MKHKCSVVILLSLTISRARKSRNRGDFTTGRCWIIRADGTEIWNQISASQATEPITNDNKSVVACCVCYLFIYLLLQIQIKISGLIQLWIWIHYFVGVSHFAECHENCLLAVREMLINILKSLILQLRGKWKSDLESVSGTWSPPKVNHSSDW